MPTGYTHAVQQEGCTFADFAWSCARAFGALGELRDHPLAPIPERLQPSSYYADRIAEIRTEIEALVRMDEHAAARTREREYEEECERWSKRRIKRDSDRRRYESMLEQVQAWEPPTDEHRGLKRFMEEQLTTSIAHDCDDTYDRAPDLPLPAGEWLASRLADLSAELARYMDDDARERERTAGYNRWIDELRASVPVPTDQQAADAAGGE